MATRTNRTIVRLACAAGALALLAFAGGCARTATSEGSGGVATTLVAPAPAGVPGAISGAPSVGGSGGQSANSFAGAPSVDTAKGAASTAAPVQSLIVVNKTLRIETANVDAAIAKIRTLTTRDGGDITNMQVATATDQPISPVPLGGGTTSSGQASSVPLQAFVTVRVPAATYRAFVTDAAKLGRVLFQSETSDDVTQQHVDMQARLGNLQAEQTRLRQLFAKANKVSDMLAIEQELTRVQGDIESMQAQIAYLERQAAMATVTIELTEPTPIVSPAGTDWGVKTALTDAVRAFVNTMNGLIVLLGPALALLVFVGLPVWLIVWVVRRSVRRRRASRSAPGVPAATATSEALAAHTPPDAGSGR
jgi:hypothetical protein